MPEPADEMIPTRATLIHRLKNWKDQSSWQDFFDTYWKLIYNTALKGGLSEAEAQDVVQETIISVAKHMPSFQYDPAVGFFKTWLCNMARWRISDKIRKRGRDARCQTLPEDPGTDTSTEGKEAGPTCPADLEALWDAEWEKALLDAALARVKRRLDPQKYQIFDLCVNKDWAPAKVAEVFGISVDQVYLVKHRVREAIREEVKRLEKEIV
jgi:RNA polymerase sigma factor (sigma-70 family)